MSGFDCSSSCPCITPASQTARSCDQELCQVRCPTTGTLTIATCIAFVKPEPKTFSFSKGHLY